MTGQIINTGWWPSTKVTAEKVAERLAYWQKMAGDILARMEDNEKTGFYAFHPNHRHQLRSALDLSRERIASLEKLYARIIERERIDENQHD